MKKLAVFDTAAGSANLGDQIIMDSVQSVIAEVWPEYFIVTAPTHLRSSREVVSLFRDAEIAVVAGTNLLTGNRLHYRQWKLDFLHAISMPRSVLLGVGWWQYQKKMGISTRFFYQSVLSKAHLHAVRDEYTKKKLSGVSGIQSLNTGCPTLWGITAETLSRIPTTPARKVIVTVTDYKPSPLQDRAMLEALKSRYEEVVFWPQGMGDFNYLKQLDVQGVKPLSPNLRSFDQALSTGDYDYVGTRLHAGIRALQKSCRAVIIEIDNRAREMGRSFGLPVLPRDQIDSLVPRIEDLKIFDVRPDRSAIERWKGQFR